MIISFVSCSGGGESPDNATDTDTADTTEAATEAQTAEPLETETEAPLPELGAAEFAYEDNAPSLAEEFKDFFLVGAAVNPDQFASPKSDTYKMIKKQFNTLVLENASKPDAVQPREGSFNFDVMDRFVRFGEKIGAVLRGHTLVWHSQCPDWFFFDKGEAASAELVLLRMNTHITTTVSRYKGRIHTWDVVNEVFGDGGGLRDSYWLERVGDHDGDGDKYDFIEAAFYAARAADPDARLIINDYGLETNTNKANTAYRAIRDMMKDGVPIDGVGFQMHISLGTNINTVRQNMKMFAKLKDINPDFKIEVTELDMSIYEWNENSTKEFDATLQKKQKRLYRELFELFIELSEEGLLDSVVFWGISDGNSWLNKSDRPNYPMLIGREFRFKDSYFEVVELARSKKQ